VQVEKETWSHFFFPEQQFSTKMLLLTLFTGDIIINAYVMTNFSTALLMMK